MRAIGPKVNACPLCKAGMHVLHLQGHTKQEVSLEVITDVSRDGERQQTWTDLLLEARVQQGQTDTLEDSLFDLKATLNEALECIDHALKSGDFED